MTVGADAAPSDPSPEPEIGGRGPRPSRPMFAARVACYAALVAVLSSILMLTVINKLGVCSRFDEGAIQCTSPFVEEIGSAVLTVLLLAVFAFPVFLPLMLGGVIFAVLDGRSWWRAKRHR